MILDRCPSRRRLLREISSSSHLSSISVENFKKQPKQLIPQESLRSLRRRRGVCIAEEENEVFFNADDLSEEEIAAAWYTCEEMENFRQETEQLANKMLSKHSPWKRSIQKVYQQLATGSCTDMDQLVQDCSFPVSGLTRGLEKHMLLPHELNVRRIRQYQQVQYWVTTLDCREHDRSLHIVTASRRESQPSRMFAHFVALIASGEL
uniref:Uncharacterized protein n=1 Tax=Amphora coffeiformis TaxID=265554 RepID=A0A7S3LC55_9STRA|mmetsp:Transcript_5971/g.11979  ORF Transcript_5971/g.11979 Transcript_5971/m.11979 type:complete len:207 (+) Transcript_5971:74-694(+)|eukprot:scaffold3369_cov166-Amphora_coffeaeformis.AAC.3